MSVRVYAESKMDNKLSKNEYGYEFRDENHCALCAAIG